MTEAVPFSLTYDAVIGVPCVTLRGRWLMETVEAYTTAILAAIAAAPADMRSTKALYDVRGCDLHERGVAEALIDFHARTTPGMDHVGIVAGSALGAIQARRISPARTVRSFDTVEAAKAWLVEVSAPLTA